MRRRLMLVGALAIVSCVRDDVVGPSRARPAPARHVVAVVEITFRDIGSPNMTSSALVASSVAELAALHAARDGNRASFDLTVPRNLGGVGDATIELDVLSGGAVTTNGQRYFEATYRVRNAQKTDSVAFNTPRRNLTFVAVSTATTIGDTPVLLFKQPDGTPADPTLTRQMKPTGLVALGPGGALLSVSPDVLQVLTEPEVAAITVPSDVTNTFPYGFMVHRIGSVTTRELPRSPDPNQFDGVVVFAYRLPLQANPANDPSTISVMMLALDDSDTRLTESLEEQNPLAESAAQQRAASLSASTIRLLPGGSVPGWPAAKTQLICSVRTAGLASAPTASLVDVNSHFLSLSPSPYTAAGSVVPRISFVQATFSQNVTGVGPSNFIVRGLQSGQAFRGATYKNNGAGVVTTPAGSFLPGEEIEVVITSAISCPTPWVGRLRARVSTPSSGAFTLKTSPPEGLRPYTVVIGDFNRDGFPDIAKANGASDNVTIMRGDGTGSFSVLGSFPAGNSPASIASGDFNNDGILDLAVANARSNNVSILLGNGDGTFRAPLSFAVEDNPAQVVVGDLNADGALDLVVSNRGGDDISILLGNGNGTFQPQTTIDTERDPRSVALADVNGDGILDIAVANSGPNANSVTLLLGRGDGTFTARPSLSVMRNPFSIAMGDVNRDGRVDIVTANDGAVVSVLLGNGDGTFQAPRTFVSGTRTPVWVAIGDMNGDGILDLVVASGAGGVSVLLGVGDGTFPTHQDMNVSPIDPNFVTLGDVNRDGILDVALGSDASNVFGVLLGRP